MSSPVGPCEESDWLGNAFAGVTGLGSQAVLELQVTAWVGSGDCFAAGGGQVGELAIQKFRGLLRLGDVIDARTSAAP